MDYLQQFIGNVFPQHFNWMKRSNLFMHHFSNLLGKKIAKQNLFRLKTFKRFYKKFLYMLLKYFKTKIECLFNFS